MSDFHDLLSNEPITQGVFMRRYPDGLETNIPHRVTEHSETGYEWGYGGSGPADLALNILEAALLELDHKGRRQDCWSGKCFRLSWVLHQDLKSELIAGVPEEGGVIYWPALRAWIVEKAAANRLCLTCGESLDFIMKPKDYGLPAGAGRFCSTCGAWRPID